MYSFPSCVNCRFNDPRFYRNQWSVFSGYCPASGKSVTVQAAIFAKGLAKNQSPLNPTTAFAPTDTVCFSLKLKGRPSSGIASAKFYIGSHLISEAKIDVAEVNKGVFFSIGQSTYAGFSLQPTSPFPVSGSYRVEAFFNGSSLGTYPFRVVPPAGALPSKLLSATLAKAVDAKRLPVSPTKTFGAMQPVYLAVTANLGAGTGVEVNWYTGGKLDEQGTKSITATRNMPSTHFYFSFRPAGGWKPGKQEVVLRVDDKEAARYAFTAK